MDPVSTSAQRFFGYNPNLPLAIVGTIVFALFFLYLFFQIYRTKSRRFLYILPFTALAESIGYLLRALCTSGDISLIKYILMTAFLLLPPNALALVNYKALGEVVRLSNVPARFFFLRARFITWFFFASDIFAFLLQGSGGGMQVTADNAEMGKMLALIGLAVQLCFFASFAFIAIYVHRSSTYVYQVEAEYAGGRDGAIAVAEWAFYVFDGLAISLSFVGYCVYFMGDYLPKRNAANNGMELVKDGSMSSSDNLTHSGNDIEMAHTNNVKYNRNKF